jgi:hypothetical protein
MYGVVGRGIAPQKVIVAALEDIGHGDDVEYVLPWYGKVTPGLEAVYDFVIDNNIEFRLFALDGVRNPPKALVDEATSLTFFDDVDTAIVSDLAHYKGTALVLWDANDEDTSVSVSAAAINKGLPTLELTNGLVPIIFSDEDTSSTVDVEPENLVAESDDDEPMKFDKATLEVMPAAVVKRMAKDQGFSPKTASEAIAQIMGEDTPKERHVVSVTITFSDGSSITY